MDDLSQHIVLQKEEMCIIAAGQGEYILYLHAYMVRKINVTWLILLENKYAKLTCDLYIF